MVALCHLTHAPAFMPIVADFYSGMEVTVPVFAEQLTGGPEDVRAVYRQYYRGPVVRFVEDDAEGGFLSAAARAGLDDMTVTVTGNDERLLLVSRFDNLGKGASGAAIQNMNILMGADETEGLVLESHG